MGSTSLSDGVRQIVAERRVIKPDTVRIVNAVCPRVSIEVPDHPTGVHYIAGGADLWVRFASGNCEKAVVGALVHILADKACAKASSRWKRK